MQTCKPIRYPKPPESPEDLQDQIVYFTEEIFKIRCLHSILMQLFLISPSLDFYIHFF